MIAVRAWSGAGEGGRLSLIVERRILISIHWRLRRLGAGRGRGARARPACRVGGHRPAGPVWRHGAAVRGEVSPTRTAGAAGAVTLAGWSPGEACWTAGLAVEAGTRAIAVVWVHFKGRRGGGGAVSGATAEVILHSNLQHKLLSVNCGHSVIPACSIATWPPNQTLQITMARIMQNPDWKQNRGAPLHSGTTATKIISIKLRSACTERPLYDQLDCFLSIMERPGSYEEWAVQNQ